MRSPDGAAMRSFRGILTYHSLDDSDSPISVSPAAFEHHVRCLADRSIRVLPLEELWQEVQSGDDRGHAVAITFDDGFENVGLHGAPLLETFGFPSTVFVVSSHVGADNHWRDCVDTGIPILPLLDWAALGELAERGMRVGAHTRTHRALDRLSPAEIDDEIQGGMDDITTHLGSRPSSFAYPYGAVSDAASARVAQTFQVGVTTVLRALEPSNTPALLPRIDACYLRRHDALAGWGSATFRARLQLRGALRSVRHLLPRVPMARSEGSS
jgi:peptidoglycan/xylan/chitin deacetylase (PgdA/CDA1 family)